MSVLEWGEASESGQSRYRKKLTETEQRVGLLSCAIRVMSWAEGCPEEVALVPRRSFILLGKLISNEEIHHRSFCRGVEVDRLVHIVERGVVTRHQPSFDQV